jgi:glycosyltransferase involved in cell wall biosynthesis
MTEPRISVVMPVYNREQYLKESVESILNQTFTDFEFIIVDDQSTDSSWSIIQEYANNDSRIIAVKNTEKKGCYSARNCGNRLAKSKYIAVMDSDDISLPHRLQTQFDFMEQNPEIGICGSWAKMFGDKDEIMQTLQNHEEIRDFNFFYCSMIHPSVIFRNKNLILYSENRSSAQDYDLWSRMIDKLKFANIPEVLLLYRVHNEQIGSAKKAEQDNNANLVRINNLSTIGINLTEQEKQIYLDIIDWKFSPKNKFELFISIKMLENISVVGEKLGYKQHFQHLLKNFIRNIAESAIQNKVTSLKLYFTAFRKWKIFETPRANLRYIYHCLRNLLHV